MENEGKVITVIITYRDYFAVFSSFNEGRVLRLLSVRQYLRGYFQVCKLPAQGIRINKPSIVEC